VVRVSFPEARRETPPTGPALRERVSLVVAAIGGNALRAEDGVGAPSGRCR
jgi:hypothetical protein